MPNTESREDYFSFSLGDPVLTKDKVEGEIIARAEYQDLEMQPQYFIRYLEPPQDLRVGDWYAENEIAGVIEKYADVKETDN